MVLQSRNYSNTQHTILSGESDLEEQKLQQRTPYNTVRRKWSYRAETTATHNIQNCQEKVVLQSRNYNNTQDTILSEESNLKEQKLQQHTTYNTVRRKWSHRAEITTHNIQYCQEKVILRSRNYSNTQHTILSGESGLTEQKLQQHTTYNTVRRKWSYRAETTTTHNIQYCQEKVISRSRNYNNIQDTMLSGESDFTEQKLQHTTYNIVKRK